MSKPKKVPPRQPDPTPLQLFDRMVEAVRAFAATAYPCSGNVLVVLDAGPWHADTVIQVAGDRHGAEGLVSLEFASYARADDPPERD